MAGINDTHEALRDLQIMHEIDEDSQVSQRTIADRVGIALGLTNSILKRLVKKGLVKTLEMPANRLAYYLTPNGFTEKSRLILAYVKLTANFFCRMRSVVNDRLQHLQEENNARSVAILGTGELAEAVYLSISEAELAFAGIYALEITESRWLGHNVKPFNLPINADVLAIVEENIPEDFEESLRKQNIEVLRLGEILAEDMRAFAATFRQK